MGRKLLIAFILAALTCSTALCDERFKPFEKTGGVYIRLSDFYWDEHYDGEKLLDETGLLYTLGVTGGGLFSRGASFAPDVYRLGYGGTLEYFWGSVDYDGQTQAGQPVTTTVDYEGFRLEAYLGMLFKTRSKTLFFEPQLALGLKKWSRDLKSNDHVVGYIEKWQNIYSRLVVNGHILGKKNWRLKLSGGVSMPLRVENKVDLEFAGDVKLEPKAYILSPYAEASLDYKRLGMSITYESFRFGESDIVDKSGYSFLQPESYTRQLMFTLRYNFF